MIDRSRILTVSLASLLGAAVSFAQAPSPVSPTPDAPNPPRPAQNMPQDRQVPPSVPESRAGADGQNQTVTGCVQRGAGANQFTLSGADGGMWTLTGNAANLEAHVGHTVTVTGTGTGARGAGAGASGGANASPSSSATPGNPPGAGGAAGASDRTSPGQGGAAGSSSAAMNRGQLNINNVTMVSTSCQPSGANPGRSPNSPASPPLTR